MTGDEAATVAGFAVETDGGCPYCTAAMLAGLQRAFPDHDWAMLAATYESPDDPAYRSEREVCFRQDMETVTLPPL